VPTGNDYTVHVTPVTDGYRAVDSTVHVTGDATATHFMPKVTDDRCVAPGYRSNGLYEEFSSLAKPAGWSVQDKTEGGSWTFDDTPASRSNRMTSVGGAGGFASIDSEADGYGRSQDSTLITPAVDLSTVDKPVLSLSTEYFAPTWTRSTGEIDVSVDGGATWTSVWSRANTTVKDKLSFDLPKAAHHKAVQVRFHYTGANDMWWQIDNVFLGAAGSCSAVPGGLAVGQTIDANTGQPIGGSTLTAGTSTTRSGVTADPSLGDGFYTLFIPGEKQTVTASHPGFQDATQTVNAKDGKATAVNLTLKTGKLAVTSTGAVTATGSMSGKATSKQVQVQNTGSAPLTLRLAERSDGTTVTTAPGATSAAATKTVTAKGPVSHGFITSQASPAQKTQPPAGVDQGGWTTTGQLPAGVTDSVVATHDGKLYSVGGFNGTASVATGYVYDPLTMVWSPIAKMETKRQRASGGFLGDKLYVVGGWNGDGSMGKNTVIYTPATNSWSNGADMPDTTAAGGTAVLNGKLYVVGGCTNSFPCAPSTAVHVYDPKTDTWSKAANYPIAAAWQACGTIAGRLYCAGGSSDSEVFDKAYVYDPAYDSWTAIANLPAATWGSQYASANGKLIVTGGVVNGLSFGTPVNTSYAYDPTTHAWSQLPSLPYPLYRGTATAGYYLVGGAISGWTPRQEVHLLPGYDADGAGEVPWLGASASTVTLKPGQHATLTVTLDPTRVEQPGTYQGAVEIRTDGPYHVSDIPVTLTATAPASWAELSGTVSGLACTGVASPLYGAQLEIDGTNASSARRTDTQGRYNLWVNSAASPLTVLASKDGYRPAATSLTLTAGQHATADFSLKPTASCS